MIMMTMVMMIIKLKTIHDVKKKDNSKGDDNVYRAGYCTK